MFGMQQVSIARCMVLKCQLEDMRETQILFLWTVIDAVLDWYEEYGRDAGRTRIGTLLLDETAWKQFVEHMRPTLGEYAVENPPAPEPREIHFPSS